MDAGHLLFTVVFGTGAVLGVALIAGLRNWRFVGGKIAAIRAGLAMAGLIAVVVFVALAVIILPGVIALPQ